MCLTSEREQEIERERENWDNLLPVVDKRNKGVMKNRGRGSFLKVQVAPPTHMTHGPNGWVAIDNRETSRSDCLVENGWILQSH